ncbi:MAG: 30S ribosome-binding factor RbfA, partial [Bacilli bacterium]|nr:30S ribosome-binding factor RbfA [Bacilli bacterium]
VYFTCFNEDRKIVLKELKESSGFLRSEVAKRVDIRHTPELNFVYDESLEYAKRIEDKIKEINN